MIWLVWGTGTLNNDAYWEHFRTRYGVHKAPFDNGDYPMGIRDAGGGMANFDCLLCHASVVAGQTMIGAPNSTLDLQGLHDDLVQVRNIVLETTFELPAHGSAIVEIVVDEEHVPRRQVLVESSRYARRQHEKCAHDG